MDKGDKHTAIPIRFLHIPIVFSPGVRGVQSKHPAGFTPDITWISEKENGLSGDNAEKSVLFLCAI